MKDRKIKLGLLGASGKMGVEIERLLSDPRFMTRLERVAAPGRGESLASLFTADILIEFSSPTAALALVRESIRRGSKAPVILGTTGWTDRELNEIKLAAEKMPILRSSNYSLGVQICRMTLKAWGGRSELADWKVTIRDLHHTEKKDAPSGTALALREALGALGKDATIESERRGEIIGTHAVSLESAFEKLTLIHEAKSRSVFAAGALEAALRLVNADAERLPKRLLGLDDL